MFLPILLTILAIPLAAGQTLMTACLSNAICQKSFSMVDHAPQMFAYFIARIADRL
jgi:hypothetical protein